MSSSRPVRRRRLRREVRLVGSFLLLLVTLSAGYLAGSRTSASTAERPIASAREPQAPMVTLSIEPIATIAARPESEELTIKPVELESTLLPVDGSEDLAHEGR